MASNPTLLVQPIAQNGNKNAIPNTTSTSGAMSQSLGFPPETSLPLGAGGVAPSREDFNGAFNLLSGIAFYTQKGWIFAWDSGQAYYKGCEVIDSTNSKKYRCKADVAAGAAKPSSNTTSWELAEVDLSTYAPINSPVFTGTPKAPTAGTGTNNTQIATTAFVQTAAKAVGSYNHMDIITSSTTYSAPVSGWYKVSIKGGGGGGGGGKYTSSLASGGAGGGEGGLEIRYLNITAGTSITCVVGAGGSGGAIGTSGTAGGDSKVTVSGTTYTGYGGGGGVCGASGTGNTGPGGGPGGLGTIPGCPGGQRIAAGGTSSNRGGAGGGSGGGVSGTSPSDDTNRKNGVANSGGGGAGGAGATPTSSTGGNGGSGYIWFEYRS